MAICKYVAVLAAGLAGAQAQCTGTADTSGTCKQDCTDADMPAAPTGYTGTVNVDSAGDDVKILGDKDCTRTVAACSELCEAEPMCCGFNFEFSPGMYGSDNMGRCVAKACSTDELLTSRFGMAYYARDAGAVPTPEPDLSECSADTKSTCEKDCSADMPAAPTGYTGTADVDGPGRDVKVLAEKDCKNTVASCAALCEAKEGCCGFNFMFTADSSPGRCVAKPCSEEALLTGRNGMAFYRRDGGAVVAGAAPANSATQAGPAALGVVVLLGAAGLASRN